MVLKCLRHRKYYEEKKILVVNGPETSDLERNPGEYTRFDVGHNQDAISDDN